MFPWDQYPANMYEQPPLTDSDHITGPGGSGTGTGGGGTTTNVMTSRKVTVQWVYTEPEPQGACTGFEVAIFSGASIATGTLVVPLIEVKSAAARQYVGALELRNPVALRAAVRACYGGFRSAWANATAAANFTPNTHTGDGESGYITFPDGTIMQWITTPVYQHETVQGTQTPHRVFWPIPFPNRVYTAAVTPRLATYDGNADIWFQIIGNPALTHIDIVRQSVGEHSVLKGGQAHIVAFGK